MYYLAQLSNFRRKSLKEEAVQNKIFIKAHVITTAYFFQGQYTIRRQTNNVHSEPKFEDDEEDDTEP